MALEMGWLQAGRLAVQAGRGLGEWGQSGGRRGGYSPSARPLPWRRDHPADLSPLTPEKRGPFTLAPSLCACLAACSALTAPPPSLLPPAPLLHAILIPALSVKTRQLGTKPGSACHEEAAQGRCVWGGVGWGGGVHGGGGLFPAVLPPRLAPMHRAPLARPAHSSACVGSQQYELS